MGAQSYRVDIQPKHLTAHNTTRGHPIQHCLGPPRKNVDTQFVAWLSTKHCGHPKTSWVPVRLRGHPINIVAVHRKWCGSPAESTLLKRGVPPHVCGGPRSNNTWLHVEHRVDIQVLETWEAVRNNVGTHITSVWLPTTCWVGVQNRGSVGAGGDPRVSSVEVSGRGVGAQCGRCGRAHNRHPRYLSTYRSMWTLDGVLQLRPPKPAH